MKISYLILATAVATQTLYAKKTHSKRTKTLTPEEQLAGFTVADGFVIELVASEKNGVINPIDLTFDDAGRLWTQTALMYPLDPVSDIGWNDLLRLMNDPVAQAKNPQFKKIKDLYQLKTRGKDKILVIQDPTKQVKGMVPSFAEGLTIPQSILPYKNGVYVAHGSEMLYLEDTDNDGKFDKHKSVLTGFGFTDTHTMAHTLQRAPGGWVHFSQGALNRGKVSAVASGQSTKIDYSKIARFSLDGEKIELVSSGLNNIWGYQLRANGQWYGTEANDMGFSVAPMEPMTGFSGIGNQSIRPYQPRVPRLHKFRVGGTGISGLAFSEDGAKGFPVKWKNVAFLANPITSTINAVRIDRDASGKVIAKHLPDFLTSKDDWFRPVNIEFGPDGCLYIADWYNKIVSHNELPTTHPDRDRKHGRIWRIRHKSQNPLTVPNLIKASNEQLVKHLSAEILWEKRAAWHQIVDRKAVELVPALKAVAKDKSQPVTTRIYALWSLEGLKSFDEATVLTLLSDSDADLRRETTRSLVGFGVSADQLVKYLRPLLSDKHCMVRSQVLRTLAEANKVNAGVIDMLVTASKEELKGGAMGGAYERKFERYLARKALEQYPVELNAYLIGVASAEKPLSNRKWAMQALPQAQKEAYFVKIWDQIKLKPLDVETFVSLSGMLGNPVVFKAVKPFFSDPANANYLTSLAERHQARVQSAKLNELLSPALKTLIGSTKPQERTLAMTVAAKFRSTAISSDVVKLLEEKVTSQLLAKALPVLLVQAKQNAGVFKKLSANTSYPFKIRLQVLHALAKGAPAEAQPVITEFLKGKSPELGSKVVAELSKSNQGAKILLALLANKVVTSSQFDISAAERVSKTHVKDQAAKRLLGQVRQREQDKKKLVAVKVAKYIEASNRLKGNVEAGKATFQSCLMCHRVGDKGFDIAPALDGSASREIEALLTALVDPNVAVEGGYNLYRITKKDGGSAEGFMFKKDDKGTTVAMMGGAKVFVSKSEIKEEGFVGGRSFMPDYFGNLPEQNMVDLLSYIKTLKAKKPEVSLFDGKTLKGWKPVVEKNLKYWSVVDGVITASSGDKKMPTNTYLATTHEYENFEFTCDFRLSGQKGTGLINSGLQYRSFLKNNKIIGYQADIGNGYWGDIYDEHRRGLLIKGKTKELMKNFVHDGWNKYTIRCEGDRHQLFINGKLTADWAEKDTKMPKKGVIALQLHSGGICKMEYKNIKIKEL